jgi:hypothetical protein
VKPQPPAVEKKKFPWEDEAANAKYDALPIKSINQPMIPSMQAKEVKESPIEPYKKPAAAPNNSIWEKDPPKSSFWEDK